jgi:hypothetical protein
MDGWTIGIRKHVKLHVIFSVQQWGCERDLGDESSGVSTVDFEAQDGYSQWPSQTEINLKKQLYTGFPFVWLHNWKLIECRKYTLWCPLDPANRGRRAICKPPPHPLRFWLRNCVKWVMGILRTWIRRSLSGEMGSLCGLVRRSRHSKGVQWLHLQGRK